MMRLKGNSNSSRCVCSLLGIVLGLVLLAGCAQQDATRKLKQDINDNLLHTMFMAIKLQDWNAVRQYLTDDVTMMTETALPAESKYTIEKGKDAVIERLKRSPTRLYPDVKVDFTIPEVDANHAVVSVTFYCTRETDSHIDILTVVGRMNVVREHEKWLVLSFVTELIEKL